MPCWRVLKAPPFGGAFGFFLGLCLVLLGLGVKVLLGLHFLFV